MSRNLCHKSSPIPLWNLTDSQIVTNGSWQKPIRTLSDLKIVTNGAWQKTYPKFFGLENCHKWGVTKNLSELCRTQKLSEMGCDKKSIRTLSDLKIGTNVASQKNLSKIFRIWNFSLWHKNYLENFGIDMFVRYSGAIYCLVWRWYFLSSILFKSLLCHVIRRFPDFFWKWMNFSSEKPD